MAPRQPTPINTINPQAPEPDAYLRTKVMTARPEELRLMLIDGAIKFATQGRDGLVNKDFEASFTGLSQARDIVLELMTSIGPDADPDLAERVKGLYSYLYSELVKGSFERDHDRVGKAIELLTYERETWTLAIERLRNEQDAIATSSTPAANTISSAPANLPSAPSTSHAPRPSLSLEA